MNFDATCKENLYFKPHLLLDALLWVIIYIEEMFKERMMSTCQVKGHHDKKASTKTNTQNSTKTCEHQDATDILYI